MSFISRVETHAKTNIDPCEYPATYIDILYDHVNYLATNQGIIANNRMDGHSVAIVGAGAAGLLAAYQLMQLGADVTLFEASDRAGGRLDTIYPIPGEPVAFEMGAMRVPPCEQLFNYYTAQFGIHPGGQFPDPGKVDTRIIFRNRAYDWPAGNKPPEIFNNVSMGWGNLANQYTGIYNLLVKPTAESLDQAKQAWQTLAYNADGLGPERGYSTISFYQGLVEAFVENYSQYGLKAPWTGDDFELFAALGVGSGGFGSLYSVNFAEIARLIINGLESDQQFYPGGMQQLVQALLGSTPDRSRPSLQLGACIKYGQRAKSIEVLSGTPAKVAIHRDAGCDSFDAVIVATTTRSMQVDMNLTDQKDSVLPQAVSSAVRELHLMNSSKLFVLTKTKFWQNPDKPLPSNIQADTLVRGLYCLDYYPDTPFEGYGVVLISYTWGDDSTKYLALQDPVTRLEACLRSIEHCAGEFVAALRSEILYDHIQMIDWQYEPNYFGAFKLNQPGQDQYNQRLYSHFLTGKSVFLAGDSVGWCGGWIESALQSGMNAACAVAQQLMGESALFPDSPMTQTDDLYDYGPYLSENTHTK